MYSLTLVDIDGVLLLQFLKVYKVEMSDDGFWELGDVDRIHIEVHLTCSIHISVNKATGSVHVEAVLLCQSPQYNLKQRMFFQHLNTNLVHHPLPERSHSHIC